MAANGLIQTMSVLSELAATVPISLAEMATAFSC